MDFLELAKKRYSCRNYKSDAVEDDKLMKVLEAARVAPSAVNYQPWHFYVVRKSENKAKIAEAYQREWMKNAPVLIVACGNKHISWKRADGKEHMEMDLSIALDHITLQATDLGLASCWICNFQLEKLKEILHLPENMEPVAIIPIGYPADAPDTNRHQNKRKAIQDIVSWELPE
jgi:nitroreductase